jgi:hypothetical protein
MNKKSTSKNLRGYILTAQILGLLVNNTVLFYEQEILISFFEQLIGKTAFYSDKPDSRKEQLPH